MILLTHPLPVHCLPAPSFLVTTTLFSVMIFYFDCLDHVCLGSIFFFLTHPIIHHSKFILRLTICKTMGWVKLWLFQMNKIWFLFSKFVQPMCYWEINFIINASNTFFKRQARFKGQIMNPNAQWELFWGLFISSHYGFYY